MVFLMIIEVGIFSKSKRNIIFRQIYDTIVNLPKQLNVMLYFPTPLFPELEHFLKYGIIYIIQIETEVRLWRLKID